MHLAKLVTQASQESIQLGQLAMHSDQPTADAVGQRHEPISDRLRVRSVSDALGSASSNVQYKGTHFYYLTIHCWQRSMLGHILVSTQFSL